MHDLVCCANQEDMVELMGRTLEVFGDKVVIKPAVDGNNPYRFSVEFDDSLKSQFYKHALRCNFFACCIGSHVLVESAPHHARAWMDELAKETLCEACKMRPAISRKSVILSGDFCDICWDRRTGQAENG